MDLVKLISEKANDLASSGKLAEIVEKHVLNCVEGIVKDSFEWSGEGKKALSNAIKDSLALPLEKVKAVQYQKQIGEILKNELDQTVFKNAKKVVSEVVSEITGFSDSKEVKLSEIVESFKSTIDTSYNGTMEEQFSEITLIVDEDNEVFNSIYFDLEPNKEKYECKNNIRLHNGVIFVSVVDKTPLTAISVGPFNPFESFIFKLYANQCKVDVSEWYDIDTSYYREDFS